MCLADPEHVMCGRRHLELKHSEHWLLFTYLLILGHCLLQQPSFSKVKQMNIFTIPLYVCVLFSMIFLKLLLHILLLDDPVKEVIFN